MTPFLSLYIHIPYCRMICPYCDFYKTANHSGHDDFARALEGELHEAARKAHEGSYRLRSVYVGGGTPTQLKQETMSHVLHLIKKNFLGFENGEVTVEADPGTFDRSYAQMLFQSGVNRISLGVQSFVDSELEVLGRSHRSHDVLKSYAVLRDVGFANVSMDLMCCVPKQNSKNLAFSLAKIEELAPEHVSVYALHLDAGSVWHRLLQTKPERVMLLHEAEEQYMLEQVASTLALAGYGHYEVSNYARHSSWESRHNWAYWRRQEYWGLGPSAHSFDGNNVRRMNVAHVGQYIQAFQEKRSAVSFQETLSVEQEHLERVMLGLRTREGFSVDELKHRDRWQNLLHEGFLQWHSDKKKVVLTEKGMRVYNSVVEQLV